MSESTTKNVVAIVPKIVELLEPFSPSERQRVISAAMILFGQPAPIENATRLEDHLERHEEGKDGICLKAINWMKKNGITREQLDHVFSIEPNSIEIIAANMPDSGKKKQTIQAYILSGIRSFLRNGETTFNDADARELCVKVGCYDSPNHSTYTTGFGNTITGSKSAGWRLTNPGLSTGVHIIKQLGPETAS